MNTSDRPQVDRRAELGQSLSAVILAAGKASRMGRQKLALPFRGSTILQKVIDAADGASVDEIIIVVGAAAAEVVPLLHLPERAHVVVNENFEAGLSSSLLLGVRSCAASSAAAALLLGDQPTMSTRLIDHVVEAWRKGSRPIAFANYRGVPGHPVVISRSIWPRLEGLRGDKGAMSYFQSHRHLVEEVSLDESAPRDVDSPKDYDAIVGRLPASEGD